MRKQKPHLPIKFIIVILIFLVTVSLAVYFLKRLKNSEYFKVKVIVSNEDAHLDYLSYLKGRNIFSIDLQKESSYILELYPNYKKVRIVRILPSRLFLNFEIRKPIGIIKLYRYFCVDEDSILFDVPKQCAELPVILGLDTKIFGPKSGSKCDVPELTLALDIIKELKHSRALEEYKIEEINVLDPGSASFFILKHSNNKRESLGSISESLEVKIGQDDIKSKIDTLSNVLRQIKHNWDNIKYVDLRFKEPVIKLKDDKP